jgi:hypothetical protein
VHAKSLRSTSPRLAAAPLVDARSLREQPGDDWTPKPAQDRQGVRHERNDPGHFSATAGDASVRSASKM